MQATLSETDFVLQSTFLYIPASLRLKAVLHEYQTCE